MNTPVYTTTPASDKGYAQLLGSIQQALDAATAPDPKRSGARDALYKTDTIGLYDIFLDALPIADRQQYTCHACRNFITRHGGLVTIDSLGKTYTAVLPFVIPPFFQEAVGRMRARVLKARVTSVFYADKIVLGVPMNTDKRGRIWPHMAAVMPPGTIHKNAKAQSANSKQDHGILARGIARHTQNNAQQALRMLDSGHLEHSNIAHDTAQWLVAFYRTYDSTKRLDIKDNLLWHAVGYAESSCVRFSNSMMGVLLDGIAPVIASTLLKTHGAEAQNYPCNAATRLWTT